MFLVQVREEFEITQKLPQKMVLGPFDQQRMITAGGLNRWKAAENDIDEMAKNVLLRTIGKGKMLSLPSAACNGGR